MNLRATVLICLLLTSCSSPSKTASTAETAKSPTWDGSPESSWHSRVRPTVGAKGIVVAENAAAAAWGAEILRRGGNAIDAAVATAFALTVARPHEASLGGGGFMVYCPKPDAKGPSPCTVIDYREEAPAGASRDMYVRDGKAQPSLSQDGALASGVPGVVAGLTLAQKKFGTLPLPTLLTKPIEMARKGIRFTGWEEAAAIDRWDAMNEPARKVYGCGGDSPKKAGCSAGATIVQADLAKTLVEIARHGRDGFYRGWVARKIVASFKAAGGLITEEDLAGYEPKLRDPIRVHYRGYEVVTMPPPSNGGTAIAQMLSYAELADHAHQLGDEYMSARTLHVLAHAMQLAFADRAQLFGDPDQVAVPVPDLLSTDYLENRWKTFDPNHANLDIGAGLAAPEANPAVKKTGKHTTHFSVIDREGNAVAITTTLNDDFGSGFMPAGTGVMMNNEMDDFSAQPGAPNMFGLVGGEANAIAPHKRPVSSMSPTIVRDSQGRVHLVLGAAGGPTITTSVFLTLVQRLRFGTSLPDAVAMGRIHQQWRPKELKLDLPLFSESLRAELVHLGYSLKGFGDLIGRIHGLERFPDNGHVWGVADGRAEGAAIPE